MAKVDFFRLERSIQERFIASTQGAAAPAPLAVRALARDSRVIAYALAGLAAAAAGIVSLRLGFGDLASPYAIAPTWFIAVYAGFFTLAALLVLRAVTRSASAYSVPYRPALYLFPIGVIDARTPDLGVHKISEQTEAVVVGNALRVRIDGSTFDFPAESRAQAEQAAQVLLELRDRLASSGPESSARERASVDPLVDNGFRNPFSPVESLRRVSAGWLRSWPLLALVLGVLLGGAAFLLRNRASEARLYASARAADSGQAYREYLARGGNNPDVAELLLPRSELRDAVQQKRVAAIEAFMTRHPQPRIQPEVDAALQRALLDELATAQATGTLTALKEYGARYQHYPFVAPYLSRAIDARIAAALQQLKPALAANQTKLLPFMERLLRYTAKHGPEVRVRFQRKPTETLEAAEKALRLSAYFNGGPSLPGQYFDATHATPREAAAAASVLAALAERLPKDLVDARLAPALETNDDPKASVPTLLFTYHTEMSGAFLSRRPRMALSGIGLIAKASFEIPGDAEALPFKLTVWRAPDLKSVTDTSTPAELYETMASEAFKRFMKKYLATLFVER